MEHITKLTDKSLCDALTECYLFKHNKVVVFFNDSEAYSAFTESLQEFKAIPGVRRFMVSQSNAMILFNNGSVVEAYSSIRESARGVKCHRILYDPAIDIDQYRHITCSMIVSREYADIEEPARDIVSHYFVDRISQENVDSPELDEFLDGFKIIHEDQ